MRSTRLPGLAVVQAPARKYRERTMIWPFLVTFLAAVLAGAFLAARVGALAFFDDVDAFFAIDFRPFDLHALARLGVDRRAEGVRGEG